MIRVFKIGLAIMAVGSVWMSVLFLYGDSVQHEVALGVQQSGSFEVDLDHDGLVFYSVGLADIGDLVFVQIIDSDNNIIEDRRIETRLVVNYFEIDDDTHTVRITNIGDGSTVVSVLVGSLDVDNITYPGVVIVAGLVMVVASSYFMLNRYRTAQPDEKI